MSKDTVQVLFKTLLSKIKEYNPHCNDKRIIKAFEFAKEAHTGQTRQASGEPYIVHPISTAIILANLEVDEDTIISALLHDVPEDTNKTLDEIQKLFNKDVRGLVDGVTKLDGVQYQDKQDAKVATLKKMFSLMSKDKRVILIKLADRFHNIQTLEGLPKEKQERVAKETLNIYVPLASLFGIWKIKHSMEDMCMKILLPTEYKIIEKKLGSEQKEYQSNRNQLMKSIKNKCKAQNIDIKIYPYQKSHYSIYKKLLQLNLSLDNVHETQTLRIITDDPTKCYTVLGIIHNSWKPKIGRFKDYIAVPKKNNYRSLHTTIFGPSGVITEIQIRDKEMDKAAELGSILSSANKNEESVWLEEILAIVNSQTMNQNFIERLNLNTLQKSIFTFTPQGTVIDLKPGSTPLDFAYAIHSKIGNSYKSCKINQHKASITTPLKTGDIIEIKTSSSIHPEIDWINLVKTNVAKKNIRYYFKQLPIEKRITIGRNIIDKKLELLGGQESFTHKQIEQMFHIYNVKKIDELYAKVGAAEITIQDIIDIIYKKGKVSKTFTQCKLCENIMNMIDGVFQKNKVSIKIMLENRVGIIADIANLAKELKINITNMKTKVGAINFIFLDINTSNLNQLNNFTERLSDINGVEKIGRISQKSSITIKSLFILNIAYWLTQPFLLYTHIIPKEKILPYLVIGMFLALFSSFYFNRMYKSLFSKITNVSHLWEYFIIMNTFIISSSILERWLFQLNIPTILLTVFVLILGGTTIIEYYQYKND